jgi:hypothetical protein
MSTEFSYVYERDLCMLCNFIYTCMFRCRIVRLNHTLWKESIDYPHGSTLRSIESSGQGVSAPRCRRSCFSKWVLKPFYIVKKSCQNVPCTFRCSMCWKSRFTKKPILFVLSIKCQNSVLKKDLYETFSLIFFTHVTKMLVLQKLGVHTQNVNIDAWKFCSKSLLLYSSW